MAQLLGCFEARSAQCKGHLERYKVELSEGPVVRASQNENGRYHGHNLLVKTLQDNYGDKTAIKNAHCVALVTMVKPQHTASALRTFYDSLMSDMRSLATLDLPTTRYGDFYVPILLKKLSEKLLTMCQSHH